MSIYIKYMDTVQIRTRAIKSELPEVTITDKSAEEKLYEFVDAQIEKMRKYTSIGGGTGNLQFYELNEALCNWSNINCSYIALDVIAKEEYQKAKDAYDDFVAEKYSIIRSENNLQSISAQKWLSSTELDMLVRIDPRWAFELKGLRDEMNAAEKRVSLCRRMLDNLEAFKFTLGTLSKNIQSEVLNLSGARELGLGQ